MSTRIDPAGLRLVFGALHTGAVLITAFLVWRWPEWNGAPGMLHDMMGDTQLVRIFMGTFAFVAVADFLAPTLIRKALAARAPD